MVRVTLFYDLGPFLDEEAFYSWQSRLLFRACSLEETAPGAAVRLPTIAGGLVKRDYGATDSVPRGFVTTLDWADEGSFRTAFYGPVFQDTLRKIEAVARSSLVLLAHRIQ